MKKQYKSVPVTDMTIWQLGQAVADGGEFYDDEGCSLFVASASVQSCNYIQETIAIKLKQGKIVTQHAIPWYEVEGVFPCLVRCNESDIVMIATDHNKSTIHTSLGSIKSEDCTPLTPTEAAKYGVDV